MLYHKYLRFSVFAALFGGIAACREGKPLPIEPVIPPTQPPVVPPVTPPTPRPTAYDIAFLEATQMAPIPGLASPKTDAFSADMTLENVER